MVNRGQPSSPLQTSVPQHLDGKQVMRRQRGLGAMTRPQITVSPHDQHPSRRVEFGIHISIAPWIGLPA
jgi:hypothetical protein